MTLQHGNYNINIWRTGAKDEWYEYRLEKFDGNDRVIMDKVVRVVADDTAGYYIDSRDFAEHVATKLRSGACVKLIPSPAFLVQKV